MSLKHMFKQVGDRGSAIADAIVGIALILVLVGIGVVQFTGQTESAYRSTAVQDGKNVAQEIIAATTGYTSLGESAPATNTGFITYNGTTVTLTPTSGARPNTNPITLDMGLSDGTTITTSGLVPNSKTWCFSTSNNGQVAVYTSRGWQKEATQCAANGTFS